MPAVLVRASPCIHLPVTLAVCPSFYLSPVNLYINATTWQLIKLSILPAVLESSHGMSISHSCRCYYVDANGRADAVAAAITIVAKLPCANLETFLGLRK